MIDHSTIEAFASAFANSPRLAEMEVRSKTSGTVRFRRSLASTDKKPRVALQASVGGKVPTTLETTLPELEQPTGTIVTSTLVGVFRTFSRSPITIGTLVTADQVLGFIEVMRLSNEVTAPVGGIITSEFVQDGQPVEYGQALFEVSEPVVVSEDENASE